jgi:hypothetical protein
MQESLLESLSLGLVYYTTKFVDEIQNFLSAFSGTRSSSFAWKLAKVSQVIVWGHWVIKTRPRG